MNIDRILILKTLKREIEEKFFEKLENHYRKNQGVYFNIYLIFFYWYFRFFPTALDYFQKENFKKKIKQTFKASIFDDKFASQ